MPVLATVSGVTYVYLLIGLVIGFIAYRSSESYKRKHHVTPWHIPSLVWGLIGFISLIVCALLFLIASRTTKLVIEHDHRATGAPQTTPAGWYPDPASQHEFRYWDGLQWTDRVEDGGIEHATGARANPDRGRDGSCSA